MLVEEDGNVVLEIWGGFSLGLIDLVDNLHSDLQPLTCVRLLHKLFDQINVGEDYTLTGPCDVWKQAMFDRVVFGGIGRIMSNSYLDANLVDQSLQVFLEYQCRQLLLPPLSHWARIEVAVGYATCPWLVHQFLGESHANSLVSPLVPRLM